MRTVKNVQTAVIWSETVFISSYSRDSFSRRRFTSTKYGRRTQWDQKKIWGIPRRSPGGEQIQLKRNTSDIFL